MATDKNKLPLAHPTTITWVAIAAVVVIVALYILWTIFLAEPAYPLLG